MKPIVFVARGLPLDTRLDVLGTEFHVHSAILKMKSNFFFKFMNSPDKTVDNKSEFKYEWISRSDEDGSWALVANDPSKTIIFDLSKLKGDINCQVKAFEHLLCAMYGEAPRLSAYSKYGVSRHLTLITDLADYYCALPALSNALGAFLHQSNFHVYGYASQLLGVAHKLRHAGLFRDCVCVLASPCQDGTPISELYPEIIEIKLQKIVTAARAEILELIVKTQTELVTTMGNFPWLRDAYAKLDLVSSKGNELGLAGYYRKVAQMLKRNLEQEYATELLDDIAPLVKNNLVFDPDKSEWDSGDWGNSLFLCGKVADQDLPWDMTQKDW